MLSKGTPAPDFKLLSTPNQAVSLSDFPVDGIWSHVAFSKDLSMEKSIQKTGKIIVHCNISGQAT